MACGVMDLRLGPRVAVEPVIPQEVFDSRAQVAKAVGVSVSLPFARLCVRRSSDLLQINVLDAVKINVLDVVKINVLDVVEINVLDVVLRWGLEHHGIFFSCFNARTGSGAVGAGRCDSIRAARASGGGLNRQHTALHCTARAFRPHKGTPNTHASTSATAQARISHNTTAHGFRCRFLPATCALGRIRAVLMRMPSSRFLPSRLPRPRLLRRAQKY
eukprot:45682-Rhodomonas_salina.1